MIARYRLAKPLFPRGRASFQKSRTQFDPKAMLEKRRLRFEKRGAEVHRIYESCYSIAPVNKQYSIERLTRAA